VVFTFGVLILRQISKVSVVDNAFMNLLLLIAVAFHFRGSVTAIPIFYSAAAVMLTVAAIQESYFIAYLDELTSLPARRSLQEEMDRLTGKYTIAMVDVDYFKKINDTYGHDIGDDVLRLIASILQEEICGGKAFRYGGEEFTLLFPGKEGADILPHLEDLREKIAKRPFFLRIKGKSPKKIWVTASIGYGESVGKCSSPDEVIKAADAALYKAKANGRNCVCK
jgi:diguanylate cyclase (GGDEF)-like protein